jgi:hypothetical protein
MVKDEWAYKCGELQKQCDELAAQNAVLREALKRADYFVYHEVVDDFEPARRCTQDCPQCAIDKALAITPPAALEQLRKRIAEECAAAASELSESYDDAFCGHAVGAETAAVTIRRKFGLAGYEQAPTGAEVER